MDAAAVIYKTAAALLIVNRISRNVSNAVVALLLRPFIILLIAALTFEYGSRYERVCFVGLGSVRRRQRVDVVGLLTTNLPVITSIIHAT